MNTHQIVASPSCQLNPLLHFAAHFVNEYLKMLDETYIKTIGINNILDTEKKTTTKELRYELV